MTIDASAAPAARLWRIMTPAFGPLLGVGEAEVTCAVIDPSPLSGI